MYLFVFDWYSVPYCLVFMSLCEKMGGTEKSSTILNVSHLTKRPRQTGKAQIRLLLREQSDQGLHSLVITNCKGSDQQSNLQEQSDQGIYSSSILGTENLITKILVECSKF